MIIQHIPSPIVNAQNKIEHLYTGSLQEDIVADMNNCNPSVSGNIRIFCFERSFFFLRHR
jgi:hypothetical protein